MSAIIHAPPPPEPEDNNNPTVARFTRDLLEHLQKKLPEYAEEKGTLLIENGSSFTGYCPIHNDTRPSFSIYGDSNQRWKCFACDLGGDVFDLSRALGLSNNFREAVQEVAKTLGVPVPKLNQGSRASKSVPNAGKKVIRKPKPPIPLDETEEAFRLIARYDLRKAIRDSEAAASQIVAELGIPIQVISRAARGASGLGLVEGRLAYVYPYGVKIRNEPGHTNRFRWACGRAYAPWRMERVSDSTETVYLTEGESDALALIAAGVEDSPSSVVVASPGVSFPDSWATLFAGKNVVICFDFDEPGRRASGKVAELLSAHGATVSIANLGA